MRNPVKPILVDRRALHSAMRQVAQARPQEPPVRSGEGYGQSSGPPGMGPPPPVFHAPGGRWTLDQLPQSLTVVDRLFRILPDENWFSTAVTRSRPIKATMGSFTVPSNQAFFLNDYEFGVLTQSGLDPFDFQNAAPGRFSGFMGFDLRMDGFHSGNLSYQLDPSAANFDDNAFRSPEQDAPARGGRGALATRAQFQEAASNSFANVAGVGTSLLPVTDRIMGPRQQPWAVLLQPGATISVNLVVFRRVTAPIAGVQARISGHLLHTEVANTVMQRVRIQ